MKMKHAIRSSAVQAFVALALVVSLGLLGCSNALGSKPAANQASHVVNVEVIGAGGAAGARSGTLISDWVSGDTMRVSAFDSAKVFLGVANLTVGASSWTGTIDIGAGSGMITFRAYNQDSTGAFKYWGTLDQTFASNAGTVTIPVAALVSPRQASVPLATAGNYTILAQTGITTLTPTSITGNIGISPGIAAAITGLTLTPDGTGAYATSPEVVSGNVYASDYVGGGTPTILTTAIGDMGTAYTNASAAARTPDISELGGGTIGAAYIKPGCYKWAATVHMTGDIILDGSATDVWVFQIGTTFTMDAGMKVILAGGALPQNVFWAIGTATSIGAGGWMKGIVLDATSVGLVTGAKVTGRILAQTSVAMDQPIVAP